MSKIDFFTSGANRLSCVWAIPEGQEIKAGLVFVHAAEGSRLGPHRMFVELAEKLKQCGIASVRFDMRGCGDSGGEGAGDEIAADIEDMLSAIDYFSSEYDLPKIFLFGISRGARVSMAALAEHGLPIDGALLLSMPLAGAKAAAKKFTDRLKEYLYKFKNPESLKKFVSGKANLKQIAKTLIFAVSSQKRYRRNSNGFVTRCPLFFIYGSKDPIAADSAVHYGKICEQFNIPSKTVEIKNANHSFFHYYWKERIFEMTEKWLTEKIRGE